MVVKRLKFVPHDYQQTAIDFAESRKKSLLVLDMGLGKTVITLTVLRNWLKDGKVKRPLIVAPKIVADNTWTNELRKWQHLRNVKFIELDATDTKKRLAQYDRIKDGTLTIISESKIQWLVDMYTVEEQKTYTDPDYSPRDWEFDCIVLDEASMFKDPSTNRYQNLEKRVNTTCKRVIGLTGTPTPNSLADLWAIMKLIDKGVRLGKTRKIFRKNYCNEKRIKINSGNNQQYRKTYDVKEAMYENILDCISDIALAMKAEDYLEDFERPDIIPVPVWLSENGMSMYKQLLVKKALEQSIADDDEDTARRIAKLQKRVERLVSRGTIEGQMKAGKLLAKIEDLRPKDNVVRISADGILAVIGKARQLAGGACYEDIEVDFDSDPDEYRKAMKNRKVLETDNAKVDELDRIIEQHSGTPVLIFTHFKHEAKRIMQRHPEAVFINSKNSRKVLPAWNRKEIPVLIANPVSTKFGLNMQDGGHVLVWFGLNYSFEEFTQSNARLARQGQKEIVQAYILQSAGTIDVEIAEAVQNKQRTNNGVYDYLKEDGLTETANDILIAAESSIKDAFKEITGKELEKV